MTTSKCGYEIKLKPDAQPHAVFTARTVSIPLHKKELDHMESLGVISLVEGTTEWCAVMLVVLKKAGAVRICVDF